MSLPIFGPEQADCDGCELVNRCAAGRVVAGVPGPRQGGILILGEGPGVTEVQRGEPFVGAAGRELNEMLEAAGIDRADCHVSNATLCLPPKDQVGKVFTKRFPNAVPACLPRLEAELEAWRPKVVVTLGRGALAAATGYFYDKNMQVDNTCERCDPKDRKVGPAIRCAARHPAPTQADGSPILETEGRRKGKPKQGDKCSWYWLYDGDLSEPAAIEAAHAEMLEAHEGKCPSCSAKISRLKIRRIKCPACGGLKKRVETVQLFKEGDHALLGKNGIAGALFIAAELPARWDRFGVQYVIATLHPSFVLRSSDSGENRGLSGQFAARVMVDHFEKARRLCERPHLFSVQTTLTDRAEDVRAFTAAKGVYVCDIETNAKSPWDVTDLRCIGISRAGSDDVLVVDTRRMLDVQVTEEPGEPFHFDVTIRDQPLYDALREFLTDPDKPLEGLNFEYDAIVIRRLLGLWPAACAGDGKLAHHCLWPDEPHTLGHIASALTDAPYWKPPKQKGGVESFETFTELAVYNAKDVRATDLALQAMAGSVLE